MADPSDRGKELTQGTESASPYYIPATAAGLPQKARVLKNRNAFAVLDEFGNAQASGPAAEGLFFDDTRYLSRLALTIDRHLPLLLCSAVSGDVGMLSVDLTNPDVVERDGQAHLPRSAVHVRNELFLAAETLFATVTLHSFRLLPARFRIGITVAADFADIFEVRGAQRPRRGAMLPVEQRPGEILFAYRGLDGVTRRTRVSLDPLPSSTIAERAIWEIELPPGGSATLSLVIGCERDDRPAQRLSRSAGLAAIRRENAARAVQITAIETSNEAFNDWLNRSRADLDMLITETPQGPYAYAGIPWFSTAFGRDGLIAALECLWLDPSLAAGTLRFLAAHQAKREDAATDAEPGKILHETRGGEMAALGEVPFGRYYGSVDATPLFIVLAAAYHARTGDLALIRDIWPAIDAALGWMRDYGLRDGFLAYDRRSVNGLINQGWKDSDDAVFHADGRLAEAPIAMAEVQAYAYAAWAGAAELTHALGRPKEAAPLLAAAEDLRRRFDAAFWLDDLGTYALALDGENRPCRVRSSNAGQVLFSGLAMPERAARLAESLMSPAIFSGWGIRTIAEGEARYNPISYHNGSVWPHDNAMIALGLARHGLTEPLWRLMAGLFEAATFIELRRLPELFCGFPRRAGSGPTAYPVACSPQAWAAGASFAVLGAALRIDFVPADGVIRFDRPTLPAWLDRVRLTNLRLGEGSADIELRRSGDGVALDVLRRAGPIDIALTR